MWTFYKIPGLHKDLGTVQIEKTEKSKKLNAVHALRISFVVKDVIGTKSITSQ